MADQIINHPAARAERKSDHLLYYARHRHDDLPDVQRLKLVSGTGGARPDARGGQMHGDVSNFLRRNLNREPALDLFCDVLCHGIFRQPLQPRQILSRHFDLFSVLQPADGQRQMDNQAHIAAVGILNPQLLFALAQRLLDEIHRLGINKAQKPVLNPNILLILHSGVAAQQTEQLILINKFKRRICNRLTIGGLASLQTDADTRSAGNRNLIVLQPCAQRIQIAVQRALGDVIPRGEHVGFDRFLCGEQLSQQLPAPFLAAEAGNNVLHLQQLPDEHQLLAVLLNHQTDTGLSHEAKIIVTEPALNDRHLTQNRTRGYIQLFRNRRHGHRLRRHAHQHLNNHLLACRKCRTPLSASGRY